MAQATALVYLALAKWATYLGLIGLTGAVVARRLLRPADLGPDPRAAVDRRLLGLVTIAGAVTALAAAGRLYAQTYSIFGLDEPVTLELLRVVGVESRWASRWQPQAALAMVAAAGAVAARWRERLGWRIVTVSAVLLWVALPLTGHAMSWSRLDSHYLWLLQSGHGLAAGAWLGTLVAILMLASPLAGAAGGHRRFADMIGRFSPLVVRAVATVIVTGGLTAWFYIDTASQLWSSPYGRTFLLKAGLVALGGAVGAYNWRRLTPRLGAAAGTRALRRSIRVEVAVGLVLLAVTAVLVHLATPDELE